MELFGGYGTMENRLNMEDLVKNLRENETLNSKDKQDMLSRWIKRREQDLINTIQDSPTFVKNTRVLELLKDELNYYIDKDINKENKEEN